MAALMLHSGGALATRQQLLEAPLPLATRTWQPISHTHVLDKSVEALHAAGYQVTREQLGLAKDGHRFFGILDLAREINGGSSSLAIGIRNSTDKTFPMGLVGGSRVFVCDNLSFSAELIDVRRKHTRYGELRFREAIAEAVGRIEEFATTETKRFEVMQRIELQTARAESLVVRSAMDWNLIPLQKVPAVIQEMRKPTFVVPEADDAPTLNLWGLWNAFTHVLRGNFETSPNRAAYVTMQLQKQLLLETAPQYFTAV
jgi:hypothetical protein